MYQKIIMNYKKDAGVMTESQTNQGLTPEMEPSTDKVLAIDIERIKPNPFQPRKEIAKDKVDELAQSIQASGLIQPIVVRRFEDGYQLVVGERRYLACKQLGWKKIAAAVKIITDNDMATTALIENLQRENLNMIEEANAYLSLMKSFNLTQEILAQRLGKSQSTIANKIRLLKLSPEVRSKIQEHSLTERHARALLKLDTTDRQLKMIEEVVNRGLTVNQAEKRIDKLTGGSEKKGRLKKSKPVIRDMRIVLNTIREAVNVMQNSGLYPEVDETIEEDYIEINIRLTREMLKAQKAKVKQ